MESDDLKITCDQFLKKFQEIQIAQHDKELQELKEKHKIIRQTNEQLVQGFLGGITEVIMKNEEDQVIFHVPSEIDKFSTFHIVVKNYFQKYFDERKISFTGDSSGTKIIIPATKQNARKTALKNAKKELKQRKLIFRQYGVNDPEDIDLQQFQHLKDTVNEQEKIVQSLENEML